MNTPKFDIIVIGAGHAGCEAALAGSRMGLSVLLLTINLDNIAQMSCNPSIGGMAKSQLTREIDALGGEMARNMDKTTIQFRVLNTKKGPAVHAYRAQADRKQYQIEMKKTLENTENLNILQDMAVEIIVKNNKAQGVKTAEGVEYFCKKIIITTGTFLNGYIHRGLNGYCGGRDGELSSTQLSNSLLRNGLELGRLKTGTPARINKKSVNFDILESQHSDNKNIFFSFLPPVKTLDHVPCYITYTNKKTHNIIRKNLDRSPLYTGKIVGVGPRYCPSIEDKVVKFPDKERHQIFLEPEGLDTNEVYVNGLSTSLPSDVQVDMLHSVHGLENAEVLRFGYGIEYDFVFPRQIKNTLETKKISGLYLAGQINGTSGYEEAGAQGLVAGINAGLSVKRKKPFVLNREDAYIGVLIDDLIVKNPIEPYRMFTSQSEYRLYLRNDNADLRLTEKGYEIGLVSKERYEMFKYKK
ncbi:tRNA uridine-5-carboxymethylaminomethyl(34) synthesis enzyme MnmG, partial [bacterium]|nr:tRNA uridine-5-carboxymethylaminomethyl(34) synthesis enzyme MnmG [bacterium]